MRKGALILALVFGLDVVADAFDVSCVSATEAQACHACVCQVHAVTPVTTSVVIVPAPVPCSVPASAEFSARLSDKSFFRPPKHLA